MKDITIRRSVLIAPGSDDRKVRKALASHADEVILDLEDAVAVSNKVQAREFVRHLMVETERVGSISVRINGLDTPWAHDDLAMCATAPRLTSVIVPKTETGLDLEMVSEALKGTSVGIQALVETPRGVQNVARLSAATERLEALVLGYADLGAALGRSRSSPPEQWLSMQDAVLVAARVAGIAAIDGPHLGVENDASFERSCTWIRSLGFDGKWVIHPRQVDTVMTTFTPSENAVDEARRILQTLSDAAELGTGAVQLDGQMLDEALAVAARRTLARAGGFRS